MSDTGDQPTPFDKAMRVALFLVAGFCLVGGLGRAFGFSQFDETAMKFFGVAAAILVLHQFTTIELPGVKLEKTNKRLDRLEAQAALPGKKSSGEPPSDEDGEEPAKEKVDNIRVNSGAVSAAELPPAVQHAGGAAPVSTHVKVGDEEDEWESDPNFGKFGGSPSSNGRVVIALIEPVSDNRSAACDVSLIVRSTDPDKPLAGSVTFYLHPTFGSSSRFRRKVKGGVAKTSFTSWGTFTVGVETDDGATKLEINLADVPGGTKKFYEN